MGWLARTGRRPLTPAVVLGVGLGGFIDGIVLHQVLQWHHLLTDHGDYPSNTVRGLEVNTLWDGLFHAFTWVAVVLGVVLAWRNWSGADGRPPSARTLVGGLAIGWGAFNLVEGVIDHHILTLHHVRDDVADPLPWDLGFLALGLLLVAAGLLLVSPRWGGASQSATARGPT